MTKAAPRLEYWPTICNGTHVVEIHPDGSVCCIGVIGGSPLTMRSTDQSPAIVTRQQAMDMDDTAGLRPYDAAGEVTTP